jgi:hypothetical protein
MGKAAFLTIIIVLFALQPKAQLTVYKTYTDYKNNTGTFYDASYKYKGIKGSSAFGGFQLNFESNGKPTMTVHCGSIWGFKYRDSLFRIAANGDPAVLTNAGKMCFYQNGYFVLRDMEPGSYASKSIKESISNYVSKDMESELIEWPIGNAVALAAVIKKFKSKYPETSALLDCIYNNRNAYLKMKDCIKEFNMP